MRILSATDLMPKSEAAVERAGQLAQQLGAELTLLHVVSPEESRQDLEHTLQAALARTASRAKPLLWRADRKAEVTVRVGNPARVIIDVAAQPAADLVVLGPHDKRPLRDALEGTIAEKIVATRRHPVLIVREQEVKPYRRVLLALDLSDASASAIRAAESLVLTPDAQAIVTHAHNPPYREMMGYVDVTRETVLKYMREWRRAAACSIRDLVRYESEAPNRFLVHVEQTHATPGILRSIGRFSPDLLVMGTHASGRLRRALIGSVANRVLSESRCDVLIVPNGSMGAVRSKLVAGARRPRGEEVQDVA